MVKVIATLPNGRIVDGAIISEKECTNGTPFLVIDGKPYSGLDAICEGISIDNVSDPIIDNWLSTLSVVPHIT